MPNRILRQAEIAERIRNSPYPRLVALRNLPPYLWVAYWINTVTSSEVGNLLLIAVWTAALCFGDTFLESLPLYQGVLQESSTALMPSIALSVFALNVVAMLTGHKDIQRTALDIDTFVWWLTLVAI
jgi:hypothetical protein